MEIKSPSLLFFIHLLLNTESFYHVENWRDPNVIENYTVLKQRLICFTVKQKGGHEYSVIEKALGFEQTERRNQYKDTVMLLSTTSSNQIFHFQEKKQSLLAFREYRLFFWENND